MSIEDIPLSKLKISDQNVRKNVGDVSELAASISEKGVLQPPIVRPEDSKYGVVMGSRRFSAAKKAKLKSIPCIVQRDLSNHEAMVISLVENLQRGDLEPKDTAEALALLMNDYSSRELAKKIGKNCTYVSDMASTAVFHSTLEKHGVRSELYPKEESREAGEAIPIQHVINLSAALKDVEESGHPIAEERQIEIAKAIAPVREKDTRQVLKEFRKDPDRSIEDIIWDVKFGHHSDDSGLYRENILQLDSISVQFHNKLIYNLKRTEQKHDFYTTGYSNTTIEFFIERLETRKIKTVIDIRKIAFSVYKQEFSKEKLAKTLNKKGITYVHLPQLGVEKELREELATDKDYKKLWDWYDQTVLADGEMIDNLFLSIHIQEPYVFMCTETDPSKCHRHRLARWLEQRGEKSLDL